VKALVEITEVIPSEDDAANLWGGAVNRPAAGDSSPTYAFDVEGWALGRRSPVAMVHVVHDDIALWRVPTTLERTDVATSFPDASGSDRAGFYIPIGALTLSSEFELSVVAALEDGTQAPIATIRGRRAPLNSAPESFLQPQMVTSRGRTRTTAVLRILESHPATVVYKPFEYEPRVATYWTEVLRALAEPQSYLRQLGPANIAFFDRGWFVGTRVPMPRNVDGERIQRWMGADGIEALATFCQQRIESLYREMALDGGRPDALYFVEKYPPRSAVTGLMWELYPKAREVILVRDFRDMVSSILAFDAKRGFHGFGRRPSLTDAEYIERLGIRAAGLIRSWQERRDRSYLLRYEDLILRPAETIEGINRYLGYEVPPGTAEAMLDGLRARGPETERHSTSADAEASIGRWRRDLDPELQRACHEAFGEALEVFGYSAEDRA
jgi:hypothetical protein